MRIVISEFMSLDGVVQAPGGPEEDTSGGFRHGGWSGQYFDPEVMGPVIEGFAAQSEALLQGRRTHLSCPRRLLGQRTLCSARDQGWRFIGIGGGRGGTGSPCFLRAST